MDATATGLAPPFDRLIPDVLEDVRSSADSARQLAAVAMHGPPDRRIRALTAAAADRARRALDFTTAAGERLDQAARRRRPDGYRVGSTHYTSAAVAIVTTAMNTLHALQAWADGDGEAPVMPDVTEALAGLPVEIPLAYPCEPPDASDATADAPILIDVPTTVARPLEPEAAAIGLLTTTGHDIPTIMRMIGVNARAWYKWPTFCSIAERLGKYRPRAGKGPWTGPRGSKTGGRLEAFDGD